MTPIIILLSAVGSPGTLDFDHILVEKLGILLILPQILHSLIKLLSHKQRRSTDFLHSNESEKSHKFLYCRLFSQMFDPCLPQIPLASHFSRESPLLLNQDHCLHFYCMPLSVETLNSRSSTVGNQFLDINSIRSANKVNILRIEQINEQQWPLFTLLCLMILVTSRDISLRIVVCFFFSSSH